MMCQKLRTFLDKGRDALLHEAVSIDQNFGYVVIDLKKLELTEGRKQVLYRTLVAVLQFVAQKEKPPRGKVLQTLVDYVNSSHLKGALTLAGCNICMDPGSKGTRLLIYASCESKAPAGAQPVSSIWAYNHSNSSKAGPPLQGRMEISEPAFRLDENTLETDLFTRFTKVENVSEFLSEAKQAGMLSDLAAVALSKLQDILSLKSKSIEVGNLQKKRERHFDVGQIPCDHVCNFMNRFCIAWGERLKQSIKCEETPSSLQLVQGCRVFSAESSSTRFRKGLLVRYMQEKDWILLSRYAEHKSDLRNWKESNTGIIPHNSEETEKNGTLQKVHVLTCCFECLDKTVHGTLAKLKSIPLPIRRGLPVLITTQGALISIPSLGLNLCPNIWVSSRFCPRVPLGGGPASWL